jgi:hypothetical protein
MTQPTVARFGAGGSVPTLPVLQRLARSLDADLVVRVDPTPTSCDGLALRAVPWFDCLWGSVSCPYVP